MVAITQGRSLPDGPNPSGTPGTPAGALRDAARLRDRPGNGGDDAARHRRGGRAAHPARRRRPAPSRSRSACTASSIASPAAAPRRSTGRRATPSRPTTSPRRSARGTRTAPARRLAAAVGVPVAVIDANDAGCVVLGASPASTASSWSASLPTTRSARPGSRRRCAWSARSTGRAGIRCRPSPDAGSPHRSAGGGLPSRVPIDP